MRLIFIVLYPLLCLLGGCIQRAHAQILPVVDPYRFASSDPCSPLFPFPTSGLVAYYKLDEASTNATRFDWTTNAFDLARIQTGDGVVSYITNQPAKIINAFVPYPDYNPSGYLGLTNNAFNFETNSFTLAYWMRGMSGGDSATQSILQFGNAITQWQIIHNYVVVGRDAFFVQRASAANDTVFITNAVPSGAYALLVAVYENNGASTAGTLKFSFNAGTQNTTTGGAANSTLIVPTTKGFGVGSYLYTSGFDIRGAIDEIGIWNRALTTNEIAGLYNCGNGRQPP